MAVAIRLTRTGAKKQPYYRIVAADSRYARDGRFLELLGTYDPRATSGKVKYNAERMRYWLSQGATPSDTVRSLLKEGLPAAG
ncbi:MAG: 30S ribosomal protein S16 [Myxococcales bacterium]|nr:MAG: 30S ribosomal protein S16 [Myxococcales bacterium]